MSILLPPLWRRSTASKHVLRSPTIALCGAGMISGAHAMAAQFLGLPIVAVASRSTRRRDERARQLQAKSIDYAKLPAGADIVIVATPPELHYDHAVYALSRGAGVLLEKPLAYTLDQADRLVDQLEQYGQKVMYAENLAYAPLVQAFIKIATTIGDVRHMSLRTVQSIPEWGDFTSPKWGGGALFDLGVHPLALAVLIGRAVGAGEVVAVTAHLEGDTTDTHAELELTFGNGLHADVISSWQGSKTPEWNFQVASDHDVARAEFMPQLILEHNGREIQLAKSTCSIPMIQELGYVGQLQAFCSDLAASSRPFMDVAFGRWIMEIVCAGYVSASRHGATICVPSKCDRFVEPLRLWKNLPGARRE